MKIAEKNGIFSVSFGTMDGTEKQNRAKGKNLSIFAGDLRQERQETAIEKKKREIREKATKVLQDKFEGDLKQDESMDESRANIENAKSQMKEAQERIAELKEQIENAPEEMLQDTETMRTYTDALQAAQIDAARAENTVVEENANIRGIKKAKLVVKYEQSMAFAVEQEKKILAAGSDEIMGMAVQESMNHIDEMYQENIEKAEEEKEKKEEQAEKLEELKENRQELEQQVDVAKENAQEKQVDAAKQANETVTESSKVDKELRKLQKEAELMDEDLKGLMVDSQL